MIKYINRFISFVFIFVLLSLHIAVQVDATLELLKVHKLSELSLNVSVPARWDVFTRDMAEDDPIYGLYGLTKSEMDKTLADGNIYLNALNADAGCEIIITKIDSPLEDFSRISDASLKALASTFENTLESSGLTFGKYEIYAYGQAKYIKIFTSMEQSGQTIYNLQYYTVYDAQAINFTMHSYSGQIDAEKETTLKKVVDSVEYWKEPAASGLTSVSPSFQYVDPDSGLSFTVPEGWIEAPLSQDRDTIKVKFTSETQAGLTMHYGSVDLWSQMSELDKVGLTRGDINNDYLTEEDVRAFATDQGAAKVSKALYSGNEYYVVETTATSQVGGTTLSIPMTAAFRFADGYMYSFQFGGDKDSTGYSDFIAVLSSVRFPSEAPSLIGNVSDGNAVNTSPQPAENLQSVDDDRSGLVPVVLGVLVLASVVIVIAFLAFQRHKKNPPDKTGFDSCISDNDLLKMPSEREDAHEKTDTIEMPPSPDPGERICSKCGASVPLESAFCHKCGTKMERL